MTTLVTALPVLALAVVAAALGTACLALVSGGRGGTAGGGPQGGGGRGPGGDLAGTAATAVTAGLLLLYLVLLVLDGAGVPWRRVTVAAASLAAFAALAAVAAWRLWRARAGSGAAGGPSAWPLRLRRLRPGAGIGTVQAPGWGDLVAAAALAVLAWATLTRHAAIPDFIYHWGTKGKRFHWAGGIDLAFLADPLQPAPHPDYPWLLPSLYAVTAHLRGFFDEGSMLAWTVVFLAFLVLFARSALARAGLGGAWLQGGVALVALVTVMFCLGYELAGGGDPVLALALVAALPALVRPATAEAGDEVPSAEALRNRRWDDLRVGVAAALAASAKIEGVPLAGFLVLARLLVTRPVSGGPIPRGTAVLGATLWRELRGLLVRIPRLVLPLAAVAVPWMAAVASRGLSAYREGGNLDFAWLPEIAPAVVRVLSLPEWHGFPWLLVLLPALLVSRRLRPAAGVVAAQAGFYLLVYLTSVADPAFYVLSSLPRLLFHLLPALLVLLLVWAAPAPGRRPASR